MAVNGRRNPRALEPSQRDYSQADRTFRKIPRTTDHERRPGGRADRRDGGRGRQRTQPAPATT